MTMKNPRLAQWLEKYRWFMDEAVQILTGLYREAVPTARRVRRRRDRFTVKWRQFRTQRIRREIARILGDLLDLAVTYAKDETLNLKEREKWTRLAAYLGQTINTILNSYDEVKIEQTLDELKQYVKNHVEEG